ncbi:hypothetical protein ES332_A13G100900v1 [Gossypium tomentosum]|uniref:Uncharacterized protein n=1 Tax=Gossypium tomentosum TaxID=34277 RepID=A0A5D2MJF2_GOSTO|nr:hypothetical protein ES332_A13G100900v1 [Gossypium tomentosum]
MGVEVVDSDLAQLSIDKVTEVDKSFLHENGKLDKDPVYNNPIEIHSFHFIRYRFYEDPAIKAKLDQADKEIRNYEKAKIEAQILAVEAAAKMGRG